MKTAGSGTAPAGQGCSEYDEATNRCKAAGWGYDEAGNVTSMAYGSTSWSMAYDAENMQTSLTDSGPTGSSTWQYYYDGEGRRVKKTDGVHTVVYVYDAMGQLAAEYGNTPEIANCGRCYLTTDHLGSTRLVTDENGQVKNRYDYEPFGWEIESSRSGRTSVAGYGADRLNPKFTGKERDYDSTLGLDYFGARYFSGAQGRFTSTDPLNIPKLQQLAPEKFAQVIANPQNWNGYAYAHNNPLAKVDPDGYLTIIVPGTFNDHAQWEDEKQRFKFRQSVEKKFGEPAMVLPNNRMGDSDKARHAAAKMIVDAVNGHTFAPGEKLNIVAHSHGGNAAFEATTLGLNHKIDTLVTLWTPIRPDYTPNEGMIGQHLNVFSNNDWVQPAGGMRVSVPGSFIPMLIPAGRTLGIPGVQNLDATSTATGHSELWQDLRTWKTVVEPQIKK